MFLFILYIFPESCRGLQNKDVLEGLLSGVTKARDELPLSAMRSTRPKVVLKIAPDLDEVQIVDIADIVRKSHIDGVIVSNTTIQRPKSLISSELFSLPARVGS